MVGTPLTVLVADDSADCRELYAHWLGEDHEVLTAEDGEAALAAMREDVDIVLLDREMPRLGGLGVATELERSGYDARVVMVSSREPDFDLVEYPIDDYRHKPIGSDDVEDLLATYRAQQAYHRSLEEFFALTAKLATLEASKSREALAESDRYASLRRRVDEKRAEVDSALEAASTDWSVAFETCEPGGTERGPRI